jgi:T1SS-143 domain-containing protein
MATITTSGNLAGTITSLSGEGRIIGADGMERMAHLGDKVFLREMVVTASNAVMQLQLEDGRLFDLGNDASYTLGNGDGAIWVAQAGPAAGGIVSSANAISAGGQAVGKISVVIGDVKIVGVDGVVRVAKVGDSVFMKEVIETGADGIIQIQLVDGRTLDMGRDSKLALDADTLAIDPAFAAAPQPAEPAAAATDVQALQAQIAAGADPTQVAAATAAGGAPGAGGGLDGGGGRSIVVIDQADNSGPVESGFNTEGAGITFPTVEPEVLPEVETPPGVGVIVDVEVEGPIDPENPPEDGVFLSPDGPAILEGTNGGAVRTVTFVIRLNAAYDEDVEVTYQITPGTAEPGSDYTGVLSGTVIIPAGETEVRVSVGIVEDHFVENNETFNIVLTDAVNATIDPANSTASVIIVDDDRLPVANPDTNWAQEDLSVSASGNVLVNQAHAGDPSAELNFADTADVDDEALTVTTVDGDAANVGASVAGTYGTLVLNADGTYTYTLNNGAGAIQGLDDGETLTDTFTYTVTDGYNGNSNTTTLTVTIFGTNDAPELVIEGGARVSEEGLDAGIPDNTGNADTTNSRTFNGQVQVSDVDDEPLTVTLSEPSEALFSNGVEVEWSGDGTNTLTGSAGGETIITITIANDGKYTVTLHGQVDHIDDAGEGEVSFGVGVTVSDGTASVSDTLVVTIEDDSPTAAIAAVSDAVLVLDETIGGSDTPNDDDVAGNPFPAGYGSPIGLANAVLVNSAGSATGADVNGATMVFSLALTGDGTTDLQTTDGQVITLVVDGDYIVGLAGGEVVAFAIAIDAETGEVTVAQYLSLKHPVGGDSHDESVDLAGEVGGYLKAVITVVDGDGDMATAEIDIGALISFQDDGPSVTLSVNDGALLVLDESVGIGAGDPNAFDEEGQGEGVIGYAAISGSELLDEQVDFGSDEEGATKAYSLTLALDGSDEVDSGLVATGKGAIMLSFDGDDVVGTADGDVIFRVSIDSNTGAVTVVQYYAIQHDDFPDDHDENDDPEVMNANLLGLQLEVTDGDGDTDSASIDLGAVIRFEDDGPVAMDEASQDVVEGTTITGTLDFDAGSDGGGVTHVNGIALVFDEEDDGYSQEIDIGNGMLKVKADGSYTYNADESVDNSADVIDVATYTVTDGDGDTVTKNITFNITDANRPTAGTTEAMVDDDGLPGGNPASMTGDLEVPDDDGDDDESTFGGTLVFSFGGDGPGHIDFAAMDGETATVGTETVEFGWDGDANTLTATVSGGDRDGTDLFTVALDPVTGEYAVTLLVNVLHEAGDDENDATVALTYTVYDSDAGPTQGVDGTLNITFDDDAPTASVENATAPTLVLDETRPVGTEEDGDSDPAGLMTVTAGFAANFAAPDYGSDGAGSTVYSLVLTGTNVNSGLYALDATDTTAGDGDGIGQGAQIVLNQTNATTITGAVGGTTYFTISINATTGVVTFTQSNNIWHANTGSDDDTATLTLANANLLQVVQTVTDADGDSESAAINVGTGVFQIEDDGPTAAVENAVAAAIVLDESPVPADGDGIVSATGDFSVNFGTPDFGTDGEGDVTYALVLTGADVASGLFALDPNEADGQGAEIVLNQSGDVITGSAGGTDYFTIEVDPDTGIVTFTQLNNIWHDNTNDNDDAETLTLANANLLQLVQTVTDADGDSDEAAINLGTGVFTIEDDGPTAAVENAVAAAIVLDESPVPADGDGIVSATGDFSVNFGTPDFGTDGEGDVTYALVLTGADVASGLFALDPNEADGQGAEIVLNQSGDVITGSAGGTDYFTIEVDPDTGIVTFTQLNNIWHDNTNDNDDAETLTLANANLLQLVQTVTDADGDSDEAAINLGTGVFTIEDDGPTAAVENAVAAAIVLDESPVPADGDGIVSATGDFSVNFGTPDFGTDGEGDVTYALVLTGADVASGLFALDPNEADGQGAEIVLNQSGDVITGSAGGTDYFTIEVDPDTGIVTFTQLNNIWHGDTGDHDDAETLTLANANLLQLVQTVTDADGDSDEEAINLGTGVFTIEDDGPAIIDPDHAFLVNKVGESALNVKLDIDTNIHDNMGADQGGTLTFAAVNGTDSGFTSGLETIYLYLSADGKTLYGSTFEGAVDGTDPNVTDAASLVFTVQLNVDAGLALSNDTYSFTLHKQIDGGIGEFNVGDAGFDFNGGFTPYAYFDDTNPNDENGDQDVLLTPIPDTASMNTSNISGGVDAGASVGSGEGVRVDFVHNIGGDPTKDGPSNAYEDNIDHTFDGHNTVNGASVNITASTGSTIRVKAFDDPDGNTIVGDGDRDSITRVMIRYFTDGGATVYEGDLEYVEGSGTITLNEVDFNVVWYGTGDPGDPIEVTISGVVGDGGANPATWTQIVAFTEDGFNSIEYTYESGSTFKLGGFGASTFEPGAAVDMQFDLQLTDGDGDTVLIEDGINIQLSPDNHILQTGTDGEDILTVAADTAGTLVGLGDNDVLVGNTGNDILIGGQGNDTLTGGAGNDTFKWLSGDEGTVGTPAVDIITDWATGNNVLDLGDLLQGESATAVNLDSYLDFDYDGADTAISVKPDGSSDVTQQIVLQGIDLTAGNTLADQQIIQTLLDQSKLNVG